MKKRETEYNTSLTLDGSRLHDAEAIAKILNRDRSRFHSIPAYVKAAVLAFDDQNSSIHYSVAAKRDLIEEIKTEIERQANDMKSYERRQTSERL